MNQLRQITAVEMRLFLRDPLWLISLVLPTAILVLVGQLPLMREVDDSLGGRRAIDFYTPTMIVFTLAVLAVNTMPIRLSGYRERGVLRRMSTTPAHPANILAAQLIVNALTALASVALLIVVGRFVLDIPLPSDAIGFVLAFALGATSLLAIGALVAAVAATTRQAQQVSWPLFIVVMTVGGVYVPRVVLPEIVQRAGAFVPPGVQTMLDAWSGAGVGALQLLPLALVAVLASVTAARVFRWE